MSREGGRECAGEGVLALKCCETLGTDRRGRQSPTEWPDEGQCQSGKLKAVGD